MTAQTFFAQQRALRLARERDQLSMTEFLAAMAALVAAQRR